MKAFTLETPKLDITAANTPKISLEQVAALGFCYADQPSPEQALDNMNASGVFTNTLSMDDVLGTKALMLVANIVDGTSGPECQAVFLAAAHKYEGATTPSELRAALAANVPE